MNNTFGNQITVTLFGESHGDAVGAVLDGLAPGITVDETSIKEKMALRSARGGISTARREPDEVEILSGVFHGKTSGTPLCLIIKNMNVKTADYQVLAALARPGHADYTGFVKYHGFADPRGGGHFSGRLTAPLVAAGAIISAALEKKGVQIGTHISRCAGIDDLSFENYAADISKLNRTEFAVLDETAGRQMRAAIESAAEKKDSVGGVLETAVIGLPAGLGEPWFDSVESMLSHAIFSIPAVKGIEFGDGFWLSELTGSEANDAFTMENGKVKTTTNRNGGINGGITNGMPVLFRTAFKPTPSIAQPQRTVNFIENENCEIEITGRHDPAIVHRARAVVDALTALVFADLLSARFGTDYLGGM